MANIAVPSLTPVGWIMSDSEKLDKLLSYFFLINVSQTYLYAGNIDSLPAIIQRTSHDPDKCAEEIKTALTNLLSSYFTNVVINTSANQIGESNDYNITISGSCIGNSGFDFGRTIITDGTTIKNILKLNREEQ